MVDVAGIEVRSKLLPVRGRTGMGNARVVDHVEEARIPVRRIASRSCCALILDACRKNLNEDLLGDETLVAYAAAAGTTAADGRGRNSPYTAAVLAHLDWAAVPPRTGGGAGGDERRAASAQVTTRWWASTT